MQQEDKIAFDILYHVSLSSNEAHSVGEKSCMNMSKYNLRKTVQKYPIDRTF